MSPLNIHRHGTYDFPGAFVLLPLYYHYIMHFSLLLLQTSNAIHRAGAHWRSHATKTDLEQQQWDMETYNHWLDIIKTEHEQEGGVGLSGLAVGVFSNSPPTGRYKIEITLSGLVYILLTQY
jgi:hypothetical protein